MGQQSLYRRYRPQTFAEVVGQSHVTRTLQNALAEQRLPHACLFSGPRGTGKTSTARILAKALNCERAPTREPCNACASCREITEGSSLDVVEIDAASHGSVDDARELRDKVAYAPVSSRWKVYILDECHMLTTAANNALLKVLEEPPAHVVFVFATTEPSKVLQTVLDRCQRYEFRAVDAGAVAERILQVGEAEGVVIDAAAAALIAARTTGSVRDALGLLDQAVSYSGSTITADDVARLFGSVPGDVLFEAVDLLSERDAGACFGFTDRLIRSGQDPREFLLALIGHLRAVFLVQHAAAAQEILDLPDHQLDRLRAQANRFDPADLLRILDLAGETNLALRQGLDSRLGLEIAFVRMARPDLHATPSSLLARVERLERVAGVAGAATADGSVREVGAGPAARPASPPALPRAPRAQEAPPAGGPRSTGGTDPAREERPGRALVPGEPAAGWEPAADRETSPPARSAPAAARPVAASSPTSPNRPAAAPTASATPARTAGVTVDLDHLRRAWPSILALVKRKKILAEAMLHETTPAAYEDGELVLEFSPTHSFHREKVSDPRLGYLNPLLEALNETFGVRPAIRCVLGQNGPGQGPESPDGPAPGPVGGTDGTWAAPAAAGAKDPIDLIREGFAAEIVEET
jgi:DNA polymerase-3 subunit gamma/tau